jgi:hypothetical protein
MTYLHLGSPGLQQGKAKAGKFLADVPAGEEGDTPARFTRRLRAGDLLSLMAVL